MQPIVFTQHLSRARFAHLAAKLPRRIVAFGTLGSIMLCLVGGALVILRHHLGLTFFGFAIVIVCWLIWVKLCLWDSPARSLYDSNELAEILPWPILANLLVATPADLWKSAARTPSARFVLTRVRIGEDAITRLAEDADLTMIFSALRSIATEAGTTELTGGLIAVGILMSTPNGATLLEAARITPEDLIGVVAWAARLGRFNSHERPVYGGLARDWAAGYTPLLAEFGQNFSAEAEASGVTLDTAGRNEQLNQLIATLNAGGASVAVVAEPGTGKTALIYALAERVRAGTYVGSLKHHQVIGLNASSILASGHQSGDIERIIMQLLSEAVRAGNIIIALDEAQLFFGEGTGAVNLSQVLLPVLQARVLRLVMTLESNAWQRLKATNVALTNLITPLILPEPDRTNTLAILADRAIMYEAGGYVTTWLGITRAYALSGRYQTDSGYPGRALTLLEAAYPLASGSIVDEATIDRVIESQTGVKTGATSAVEADELLNLESAIHERMINQTRAVSVVSNALRRARAGVKNPNRPIGSFLFLGPTGVGKTELARSLAAIYFNREGALIHLDMSEYQGETGSARLLAGPEENPNGLLERIRVAPFSVVLLDEIEKASSGVLDLCLQLLEEGTLTSSHGKATSFKDAIIIATSNAGADEIRQHIDAGEMLESFEAEFIDRLISSNAFKPELLNRFDEIVLFRPLTPDELVQVVVLLVREVNATLEPQKITVTLSDAAARYLVATGYDARLGARPMRRMVTRSVEDAVAGQILRKEVTAGSVIALNRGDVGGEPETSTPQLS